MRGKSDQSYILTGNGQTYTRGFDTDGRIASSTLATQTIAVGYDLASRINALTGATTNTYGYDALDQPLIGSE